VLHVGCVQWCWQHDCFVSCVTRARAALLAVRRRRQAVRAPASPRVERVVLTGSARVCVVELRRWQQVCVTAAARLCEVCCCAPPAPAPPGWCEALTTTPAAACVCVCVAPSLPLPLRCTTLQDCVTAVCDAADEACERQGAGDVRRLSKGGNAGPAGEQGCRGGRRLDGGPGRRPVPTRARGGAARQHHAGARRQGVRAAPGAPAAPTRARAGCQAAVLPEPHTCD
jgi:hypothetical protein